MSEASEFVREFKRVLEDSRHMKTPCVQGLGLEACDRITRLEAELKALRKLKCPPIEQGDICICPIEELESQLAEAKRLLEAAIPNLECNNQEQCNLISCAGEFLQALKEKP